MPPERWGPSWGLRMLAAAQLIAYAGLGCVVMWFFFPHALLVPAMAVFAVVLIGAVLLYRAWHSRRMAGQPG